MVEKLLTFLKWGSGGPRGLEFHGKEVEKLYFLTVMKLKIKVIVQPNYYTLKTNCSVPIL